jgi:hypothetical protein
VLGMTGLSRSDIRTAKCREERNCIPLSGPPDSMIMLLYSLLLVGQGREKTRKSDESSPIGLVVTAVCHAARGLHLALRWGSSP